MVEPGDAKVKAEEGEEKRFLQFNKKKNQERHGKNAAKCAKWGVPEMLRGVEFSMAKNWPDLYLKALKKLQLYTSTKIQKRCRCMEMSEQGKVNLYPARTGWKCHTHTERNVENPCEQNYQVWGTTWSESLSYVWSSNVDLWSSTKGSDM